MFDNGVYAHKASLLRHLERGEINEDVVSELIPNGTGLPYEKSLWDYKAELPTLPRDRTPSEAEKDVHAAKMAAIVKDVVSFYNCHGGYIVVGVDDLTRKVVGFEKHFSVEDLQKKLTPPPDTISTAITRCTRLASLVTARPWAYC